MSTPVADDFLCPLLAQGRIEFDSKAMFFPLGDPQSEEVTLERGSRNAVQLSQEAHDPSWNLVMFHIYNYHNIYCFCKYQIYSALSHKSVSAASIRQ
jgi:hypothetical protein